MTLKHIVLHPVSLMLSLSCLLLTTAAAQPVTGATPDTPEAREPRPCKIDYAQMPQPRGVYSTNLWPNGIVPFEFDANVTPTNVAAMLQAMQELTQVASITFVLRTNQPNFIHIQNSDGNNSAVGCIGGQQIINIYNWNYRFIMAHELMHALGVWHEQQRPDRGQYVQIEWSHIDPEYVSNFDVQSGATAFGPYNFESIMHYGACGFSTCTDCTWSNPNCRTITVLPPNAPLQSLIGQRNYLSPGDAAVLQHLYNPPANDNCGNATPIATGTYSFDSTSASLDGAGVCDEGVTKDVWFTFTSGCTGYATLDTCGSSFDTILTVFTGTCENRTDLICNDDAAFGSNCWSPYGSASSVTFIAYAGESYLVRVGGRAASCGPGTLHASLQSAGNVSCSSPAAITNDSHTPFNTICGLPGGTASCTNSSGAPALWYGFYSTCNGTAYIDTCGSSYDTVLSVFTGSCANLVEVACNDDTTDTGHCSQPYSSAVSFPTIIGTVYLIRVSGYIYDHGEGMLNLVGPIADNATCQSPAHVPPGWNYFNTSNGLPDGLGACGNSAGSKSLWYTYTAACPAEVSVRVCSPTLDSVLSVYTGGCMSPHLVACNDNAADPECPNPLNSHVNFQATTGATYLIRLAANAGASGGGFISLETAGAPANGSCNTAAPVGSGSTLFDIQCAPFSGPASTCFSAPSSPSLWYAYTAECSGLTNVTTCGSEFDTVLSIFSGPCNHLAEIACNDDNSVPSSPCYGTYQSNVTFSAVAGTTYFVRVSTFAGPVGAGQGTGRLNITPPSPSNGACDTASIAQNGSTPFSTLCAPVNSAADCVGSSNSPAAWFDYTATCDGTVTIDTCGSTFDTVLSVFTGGCSALRALACNDDAAPSDGARCPNATDSKVSFEASNHSTYRVRITGYNGASGTGVMHIECSAPPACPCDWNRSGALNSQDFFDFITSFFAGRADYNNSGSTTSQDFFDFIACFFTGC